MNTEDVKAYAKQVAQAEITKAKIEFRKGNTIKSKKLFFRAKRLVGNKVPNCSEKKNDKFIKWLKKNNLEGKDGI